MIYVMSDIHGALDRFQSIMKQIQLRSNDTLYVLGDCIDRNEYGIRIIRQLMKMPNVRMLRGNHEQMMLNTIGTSGELDRYNERAMRLWMVNGGDVTLNSLKRLRIEKRREVLNYLANLPTKYDITVNGKRYILTHAAPSELYEQNPDRYNFYRDSEHFSLWHRMQETDVLSGDYTLIFGHTPTSCYQNAEPLRIFRDTDRIAIDCGAGFAPKGSPFFHMEGRLACLRIDDGKDFYSEM